MQNEKPQSLSNTIILLMDFMLKLKYQVDKHEEIFRNDTMVFLYLKLNCDLVLINV